jgi:putative transposase
MLMRLSSSVYYYRANTNPDDAPIQDMLTSIAEHNRRWGFWKMYHFIRGQVHPWNHKRIYRIYTELCLNIRRKPKKRLRTRVKEPLTLPGLPNTVWSMDFMHDPLMNGRSFRTLNILDDFNREVINIAVDTSIVPNEWREN